VQRWLRLFSIALPLFVLPLAGCETKKIWVQLPSFGDGSIDGIWLWRLAANGEYERQCHIPIGDVQSVNGQESVAYDQECGDALGFGLSATVERSETDPDTVVVGLWYMRWEDPGTYKISSHGAEGESALSTTTLQL